MVLQLHVQAAVDPLGALVVRDIQRRPRLVLNPRLSFGRELRVNGVHGEVADTDLYVQNASEAVRHDEEYDALLIRGQRGHQAGEPREVDGDGDEFEDLPHTAHSDEDVDERLNVEIDARDGHHWQEPNVLVSDKKAADPIECHYFVVVRRGGAEE